MEGTIAMYLLCCITLFIPGNDMVGFFRVVVVAFAVGHNAVARGEEAEAVCKEINIREI